MANNRSLARLPTTDSESEDEEQLEIEIETETETDQQRESREPSLTKKRKLPEEEEEEPEEEEEEEEEQEPAKPIGEVIKVSGKGRSTRSHYEAFEFDGNVFELEDSVLLTPFETGEKPYVAIIKDITETRDGSMMVLGQWFYRPEEAEKRGGGNWKGHDTRELFYSFHRDEVPAESVMHKCRAHFVPLHKQIPERSVHPGFFVQSVYDTVQKQFWKLTDKDYEDGKQHEIDLLVQKTRKRLGELPDLLETEDVVIDQEDQLKDRRGLKRKNMPPLDVPRADGATVRSDQHPTIETPRIMEDASELYKILANYKALTGESIRDKWLEKLLEAIKFVSNSNANVQDGDNEKGGSTCIDRHESVYNVTDVAQVRSPKDGGTICWPDAVVPAVVALEKAAHDAFELQKFNQKMRQMAFNLRTNPRLATRLVNGELEASVILYMSPNELKDGLTAMETATKEPEEPERMQMTDARCQICLEKKVGLTGIIQAGAREDRYQLECIACGNSWYAGRDEVELTIDAPSVAGDVSNAA